MGNDSNNKDLELEMHPDGYLKPVNPPEGGRIYKTDLIGKIAEGMGLKYGVPCRIVVDREWTVSDKSNPTIGISGRIMADDGQASTMRENMARGFHEKLMMHVDWKIVGEYDEARDDTAEQIDGSLTKRLIRMNVGDKLKLNISNRSPATVKTLCSRLSTALHRRYLVSGSGIVMEISRVDPETHKPPVNFTEKIRALEPGSELHVSTEEKPTDTVRSIVGRLTTRLGRKFTVSRTNDGCTVRRIS